MKFKQLAAVSMLAMLAACGSADDTEDHQTPRDLNAEARTIADETLIMDTHIDVPYRLNDGWDSVTSRTEGGDFDYERAVEGGLNAPFMSIYTPANLGEGEEAFEHAEAMIGLVERMVSESDGKFRIAHSTADVEQAFADKVIALPLGMENGAPIGLDLAKLNHFHARGIRYITLAHSRANQISDSSYDEERPNGGLSDFGHAVVRRMNQLGIMVDVSHLSDKAFYDVINVTQAPVIATHSSARHFTPGFERNMDDEMIRTLARNGGVIMINYGSAFLTEAANRYSADRAAAYEAHLEARGLDDMDEVEDSFRADYAVLHPYPFASLDDVLDHIDHVVGLVGINHVGIGSDYDGVGDSLPVGLKDVSSYPALVEGLLGRGYSAADIALILSGNAMRVWREVENVAASTSGP